MHTDINYKQTRLMYYMSVGLTQAALIRGSTAYYRLKIYLYYGKVYLLKETQVKLLNGFITKVRAL